MKKQTKSTSKGVVSTWFGAVANPSNYMTLLYFSLLLFFSFPVVSTESASAHPGRTDSSGGHTCYTNCESWGLDYGEYHYHNGGGSTGGGLSEAAQGRIAGAEFAQNENRARIESSANAEGASQGESDGLKGTSASLTDNDSMQHCSQEIKYTSTPSQAYREAFQTIYTRTCIHVYDDAYRAAYLPANESAKKTYEINKEAELVAKAKQKKVEDAKNRKDFLLIGGVVGSALAGGVMLNRYKQSSK